MRALVIEVDGTHRIDTKPEGLGTLPWLQGLVGGLIESVPTFVAGTDAWVNEEGKLCELDLNPIATILTRDQLFDGDYVAGPFVLTGGADDEGNTLGMTDYQIARAEAQLERFMVISL